MIAGDKMILVSTTIIFSGNVFGIGWNSANSTTVTPPIKVDRYYDCQNNTFGIFETVVILTFILSLGKFIQFTFSFT